jgi:hypothetical protein
MLLVTKINEGWKEGRRKVIDAEVPGVFESFQRIGFPGAGQSADND